MHYPCRENKGADQLRSYCEADLRHRFRLCRLLVFPWGGSYISMLSSHVISTAEYAQYQFLLMQIFLACPENVMH